MVSVALVSYHVECETEGQGRECGSEVLVIQRRMESEGMGESREAG